MQCKYCGEEEHYFSMQLECGATVDCLKSPEFINHTCGMHPGKWTQRFEALLFVFAYASLLFMLLFRNQ